MQAQEKLVEIVNELQSLGYPLSDLPRFDEEWHGFDGWSYRGVKTPHLLRLYVHNFKNQELNRTFTIPLRDLTEDELEKYEAELKAYDDKKKLKDQMRHKTVANEAEQTFFKVALETTSHPYLVKKNVAGIYGCRVHLGNLLVPLRDITGAFWNIQSINSKGDKAFLKGGLKKGCFHLLNEIDESRPLHIYEGFATAATALEMVPNQTAVCAFDAGNLRHVANAFREKHPNLSILICGDADDAGIKNAKIAARESKSNYLIPEFPTQHPNLTDWNDMREQYGGERVRMQLENLGRVQQPPKNEKVDYIEQWLKTHEVFVKLDGTIHTNKDRIKRKFLIDQIRVDGFMAKQNLPDKVLHSFIDLWIEERIREEFEKFSQEIVQYEPNQELGRFCTALFSEVTPHIQAVLQHFIWQVKRKILKLKVEHHMMPVLTGRTGGGKSEAVRKLITPLKELQWEHDMSIFGDQASYPLFEKAYVIFFDEMQKSAKADLASMKKIITSQQVPYRVFYTQAFDPGVMNTTFIGTSNERMVELIKDVNTNRRFFEVRCKDRADWDEINSIDYLKIWHSVDHNGPCPILPYMKPIQAEQALTKHLSEVEEWVLDVGLVSDKNVEKTSILFNYFTEWCNRGNRFKGFTDRYFRNELLRIGFLDGRCSTHRGFHARITIPIE